MERTRRSFRLSTLTFTAQLFALPKEVLEIPPVVTIFRAAVIVLLANTLPGSAGRRERTSVSFPDRHSMESVNSHDWRTIHCDDPCLQRIPIASGAPRLWSAIAPADEAQPGIASARTVRSGIHQRHLASSSYTWRNANQFALGTLSCAGRAHPFLFAPLLHAAGRAEARAGGRRPAGKAGLGHSRLRGSRRHRRAVDRRT